MNSSGTKIQIEYHRVLWNKVTFDTTPYGVFPIYAEDSIIVDVNFNDSIVIPSMANKPNATSPKTIISFLRISEYSINDKIIGHANISLDSSLWQKRTNNLTFDWVFHYNRRNGDTSKEYTAVFTGSKPVENTTYGFLKITKATVLLNNHFMVCSMEVKDRIPDSLFFNKPDIGSGSDEYLWSANIYDAPNDTYQSYWASLSYLPDDSSNIFYGDVKTYLSANLFLPIGNNTWAGSIIQKEITGNLIVLKTDTSWNYSFLKAILNGKVVIDAYAPLMSTMDCLVLDKIRIDTIAFNSFSQQ